MANMARIHYADLQRVPYWATSEGKKRSDMKSDPKANTIPFLERMSCLPSTFSKLKPYSQAESLIRRSRWVWAVQPSYRRPCPAQRERAHRCT